MNFETLIYEIERGRARITLNRPEKRNALSYQLQSELYEALWEADNDTEVHAVILRGAGKSFCAGYDLAPSPGSGPPAGDPDRSYRGFRSPWGKSTSKSRPCISASRFFTFMWVAWNG